MRRSALDALLPRSRQGVLSHVLLHPGGPRSLSDIARGLDVSPSSLQRELARLVAADILLRREEGPRILYEANSNCPFLSDLRGLLTKTVGLRDVLVEALEPFNRQIRLAFVYGSVSRSEERSGSDIDLMIVGKVGLRALSTALREAEAELGRPINPTLFTLEEFVRKVHGKHHFLTAVLDTPRLYVVGRENDLAKALGRTSR